MKRLKTFASEKQCKNIPGYGKSGKQGFKSDDNELIKGVEQKIKAKRSDSLSHLIEFAITK